MGIVGIDSMLVLSGVVLDDRLPVGSALRTNWSVAFTPEGG